MESKKKHFGIRVDADTHTKLQYIAQYEGRSINGQILHLVKDCIRDFEIHNGKIETSETNKTT